MRDITEITVCSRVTQQSPKAPAGLNLFGRERIADHATEYDWYFNTSKC